MAHDINVTLNSLLITIACFNSIGNFVIGVLVVVAMYRLEKVLFTLHEDFINFWRPDWHKITDRPPHT